MCCRYALKRKDLEALSRRLGIVLGKAAFQSRYNVTPSSVVPLIRRTPAGNSELSMMRWGLIPIRTRPGTTITPLFNIRAETLLTRWQEGRRVARCVIPASGFFEWQPKNGAKQPWYFSRPDDEGFGLAGVCDTWRGADGVEAEGFAILTTAPNELMRPIHARMPVVLPPEQCMTWLGPVTDPLTLTPLLASAPADALKALAVGPAVSNVRNDGPECIEPAPATGPDRLGAQLSLGW